MAKPAKEKKEKRAKKAKKDKDAPKRAISAFFFYNQERREKLKKEQPKLDNKEIIKNISSIKIIYKSIKFPSIAIPIFNRENIKKDV